MILDSTEYFARLSFSYQSYYVHSVQNFFESFCINLIKCILLACNVGRLFSVPQEHLNWIEEPQTHNIFFNIKKWSIVIYCPCSFLLLQTCSAPLPILWLRCSSASQTGKERSDVQLCPDIFRPEFQHTKTWVSRIMLLALVQCICLPLCQQNH